MRAWQITLKGHEELAFAPDQAAAAEMVLIRLAHAASMPPPSELIRKLESSGKDSAAPPAPAAPPAAGTPAPAEPTPAATEADAPSGTDAPSAAPAEPAVAREEAPTNESAPSRAGEQDPAPDTSPPPAAEIPETLTQVAMLFEDNGERLLAAQIRENVRPVVLKPGRFEFSVKGRVGGGFAGDVARLLTQWTGISWLVCFSEVEGGQTLAEADAEDMAAQIAAVSGHPMVAAALEAFPGASVAEIRPFEAAAEPPAEPDDTEAEAGPQLAGIPDGEPQKQVMEG